jgi:hypothetical protein
MLLWLSKHSLLNLSLWGIMPISRGDFMPRVVIKTGFTAPDGREEELTEYLCDYPDCPNIATRMLGCLVELRLSASVCDVHAPKHQG